MIHDVECLTKQVYALGHSTNKARLYVVLQCVPAFYLQNAHQCLIELFGLGGQLVERLTNLARLRLSLFQIDVQRGNSLGEVCAGHSTLATKHLLHHLTCLLTARLRILQFF